MKLTRIIALVACVTFAALAMAQQYTSPGSDISFIGGRVFYAQEYNLKAAGIYIVGGNATTGSGTSITVSAASVKLRDGRAVIPFAVGVPIQVNDANQETVVLTAIANCTPSGTTQDPFNTQVQLCTLTGNFTQTHGAGALILSGDNGFLEAMNDAGNNGGGSVFWSYDCGKVTLSTGSATTTVASGPCLTIPKIFDNAGGSVYVTTTITTSASYSVGIVSSTAAFITSCSSLTAGTNCGAFETGPAQVTVGTTPLAYAALVITANAAAGAGVIHPTVWGYTAAQSNY